MGERSNKNSVGRFVPVGAPSNADLKYETVVP